MREGSVLAKIISNAENIVFFGGAGVSTESGIPDFRGKSGIYTTAAADASPEEMLHYRYLARQPEKFMDYYKNNMIYPLAKPNPAHRFLAKLESEGKLSAVITQNIDGLHQKAGSRNVIELHGSTLRNYCMRCGAKYGIEKITDCVGKPICDSCGGTVRPDVVLYGEALDAESWFEAEKAIRNADVLIVGGTSLTVHPAAGLVSEFCGAHFIIINQTPTPYDSYAELVIREPIGKVFAAVDDEIYCR